jgi:polyisoprenoid-binding protein YceI
MRIAAIAAVLALLVACDTKTSTPTATPSTAPTGTSTGAGTAASAVPKGETTYFFGFNPVHNKVTFHSKNDISDILGSSSYVNGSATINFEAGTGTCTISIPTVSLQSDYTDRDRAMHGPTWLDVKKYPNVEFKGEKATIIEQPNIWKIDGKLTLRGVTKDTSITAKVRPLSAAIGKKFNVGDGPCLKVESEFKVKLADHGIVIPETAIATVQPEISIGIDIWGSTVKPADPSAPPELADGPGMRPPKVPADGIPGTIYELGKKPQFSIISAVSQTEIETITTKSNVLKGYVGIDAAAGIGKVRLAIASESLDTGIKLRNEHLHSPQWLDSKQFKTIEFESTKATKKDDKTWAVEGDFTMHGVKKPLTVDVQLRPIPVEKVKAAKWGETPAIAFSAKFTLKLSDFGIKINEQAAGKVSDELKVAIELTGLEKPKE